METSFLGVTTVDVGAQNASPVLTCVARHFLANGNLTGWGLAGNRRRGLVVGCVAHQRKSPTVARANRGRQFARHPAVAGQHVEQRPIRSTLASSGARTKDARRELRARRQLAAIVGVRNELPFPLKTVVAMCLGNDLAEFAHCSIVSLEWRGMNSPLRSSVEESVSSITVPPRCRSQTVMEKLEANGER